MHAKTSILHLSDLHVSNQNIHQLVERVRALGRVDEEHPASFVLITGDLTQSGREDQFNLFTSKLLPEILEQRNIHPERVIIVPGNHDVDRSKINSFFQDGLNTAASDGEKADRAWREKDTRDMALRRLDDFYQTLTSAGVTCKSRVFREHGREIGFACLNSAWLCCSDQDRGRVAITRAQIDEEVERIKSAELLIAMTHHPLRWLSDADASRVGVKYASTFRMVLSGHLHDEDAASIESPDGSYLSISSPALHAGRYPTGAVHYVIDWAAWEITINQHTWNERRGIFSPNTAFAPNGSITKPLGSASPAATRALALGVSSAKENFQQRLNTHLPFISGTSSTIARVEERFIEPNLIRQVSGKERIVSITELVSTKTSLVIEGPVRSGRTALLEYIGYRTTEKGIFSTIASFSSIPPNPKTTSAVDFLAERSGQSKATIRRALQGQFILLIDDATLDYSLPEWETIRSWKLAHPGICIIIAGTATYAGEPSFTAGVRTVEIRPMTLKAIRESFKRLDHSLGGKSGAHRLEAALSTLAEAEFPRWPWVITLIYEVSRQGLTVDASTLATVIERYVDLRLASLGMENAEHARILKRLLAALAERMFSAHAYSVDQATAREVIQNTLSISGVEEPAEQLFCDLLSSKLLASDEDTVTFTFGILQEYFLSKYMIESRWGGADTLEVSELLRTGGGLAFLSGQVDVPGLIERCLELTEQQTPPGTVALRIEDLSELDFFEHANADDLVTDANRHAPAQEEVERELSEAETASRERRRRRITRGGEGLTSTGDFLALLTNCIAILRGSMWLEKGGKDDAVARIVDLSIIAISRFVKDMDFIDSLSERTLDGRSHNKTHSVIAAVLILIVGSIVATAGSGRHLRTSLKEAISKETDDLRLIVLVMWFLENEYPEAESLFTQTISRIKNMNALKIFQLWLFTKIASKAGYGDSTIDLTPMLRRVATEAFRRTARKSDSRSTINNRAENVVRQAQAVRRKFEASLKASEPNR